MSGCSHDIKEDSRTQTCCLNVEGIVGRCTWDALGLQGMGRWVGKASERELKWEGHQPLNAKHFTIHGSIAATRALWKEWLVTLSKTLKLSCS